jgi:hypothetical protein
VREGYYEVFEAGCLKHLWGMSKYRAPNKEGRAFLSNALLGAITRKVILIPVDSCLERKSLVILN